MGKRELVFVAFSDEDIEEGFSYAVELAKAISDNILLLLVRQMKGLVKKFEVLLTSVSFMEGGEHETARKIMDVDEKSPGNTKANLAKLVKRCKREDIEMHVFATELDLVSGIRTFIKEHSGIDKILLSPSTMEAGNVTAKDLTRLVRTVSRPVVTMARNDRCAA